MYRFTFALTILVVAWAHGSVIMPRIPNLDSSSAAEDIELYQQRDLDGSDPRIVGGESTTIESFPYQVSVRLLGSHMCGGSILSSRVVVTAAHCIYSFLSASYYSVQYGSTVVGNSGNIINAERLVKNSNYDSSTINNDVALIFLASDITFSTSAQPIALASEAPAAGTLAVVSGWGTLVEGGSSPSILQQVNVQIVDRAVCQLQYNGVNEITASMLCAGIPQGGKDACQGDSGGPLVANGQLVGIVSWGVGCARSDYSGVYSNVAHLKDWIEANVA